MLAETQRKRGRQWMARISYGLAQAKLAKYYADGKDPVGQDTVQPYVCYSLAEDNGFEEKWYGYFKTDSGWSYQSKPYSDRVAVYMIPNEITEARGNKEKCGFVADAPSSIPARPPGL